MPPKVSIRPAMAEDAACLRALGMQVFLNTYATSGIRPTLAREVLVAFSEEHMAAALANVDTRFFVAELNAHLIGFAQITLSSPHAFVADAAPAKLERLYVQEPFTGAAFGGALLDEAMTSARANGATAMWLMCWVGNQRAMRFYPKQGFADRGADWYRFENEAHENRVFVKSLRADSPR